jgi:hypothetical protein
MPDLEPYHTVSVATVECLTAPLVAVTVTE